MKDYVAIAESYVDDVLSGRRPACRFERLACERHRRDQVRSAAAEGLGTGFLFDRYSANHICAFVESMPHVEGEWASRPYPENLIELSPWQCFILCSLNGWRWRATGYRRFSTLYCEVPRKNGKSALLSAVALYFLSVDGEPGAKVYCAATKMKQARIVFDVCCAMARRADDFRRRCGVTVQTYKIFVDDVTEMTPLEAKKLDGLNVHFATVDEYHEHPTPDVFDALDNARGARRQSMVAVITTAGDDIASPCYELRGYGERILEELHEDDSFLVIVYSLDEGDDPFDEINWLKSNPNLGVSKSVDYMRDQTAKAVGSPAMLGTYLRKHHDIWTAAGVTAFDMDAWRLGERVELAAPSLLPLGEGVDQVVARGLNDEFYLCGGVTGVDLAQREDFCAVVTAFWEGRELFVFGGYHVSEAVAKRKGNEQVLAWVDAGLLQMHPGHLISDLEVEKMVKAHVDHYASETVAYDPQFAASLAFRLSEAGYQVAEWRQSAMNMHNPFQLAQGLVAEGRLITNGDPVLRWMAHNTLIKKSGDFERPVKRRESQKIDGVAALLSALGMLETPTEAEPQSAYETRGIRTV